MSKFQEREVAGEGGREADLRLDLKGPPYHPQLGAPGRKHVVRKVGGGG